MTLACEGVGVAVHLGPALAKRLNRLMKDRGLNDRELGELALISRAAVYKLRHGDGNNVGINTIYNIAKALGVRSCWLAYGEGEQDPEPPRYEAISSA